MKAYKGSRHVKVMTEFLVEVQIGSQSSIYYTFILDPNSGSYRRSLELPLKFSRALKTAEVEHKIEKALSEYMIKS